MSLKTNYEDAVLDVDVNTKRRYNVIQNMDGTVSLEDATTYIKKGSDFGANDINNTNNTINQIGAELLAEDNLKFQFTKSGNDYGYKDKNGTFHPFNKVQASKTVTASTSAQTVKPDSGYHGIDSVTVNPQPHTATRATVTSNGTIDLGNIHNTRYVPVAVTSGMVNQATEVYQGTLDDNGYGQDITYTFTASSDGLYCMVGLSYHGDSSAGTTINAATTTGIMVSQSISGNSTSNRYCTMRIAFVKLKSGQSVSMTIPMPGATWPVRTAKAWLIGSY